MAGAGDVGLESASVNGRRLGREDLCALRDEAEEVRAPRPQGHDVDERQGGVRRAVQQVRTEGDRAAVIVGDDVRSREVPVPQKIAQQLGLRP